MVQNLQRPVHVLTAGFVQVTLIENQNYCYKTERVVVRTLLFSNGKKYNRSISQIPIVGCIAWCVVAESKNNSARTFILKHFNVIR